MKYPIALEDETGRYVSAMRATTDGLVLTRDKDGWSITHVMSGGRVYGPRTLGTIRRVDAALVEDWNIEMPPVPDTHRRDLEQAASPERE